MPSRRSSPNDVSCSEDLPQRARLSRDIAPKRRISSFVVGVAALREFSIVRFTVRGPAENTARLRLGGKGSLFAEESKKEVGAIRGRRKIRQGVSEDNKSWSPFVVWGETFFVVLIAVWNFGGGGEGDVRGKDAWW